jgi:hypothetical protein
MVRHAFVTTMLDTGGSDVQIAAPSAGPRTTVARPPSQQPRLPPNYILARST